MRIGILRRAFDRISADTDTAVNDSLSILDRVPVLGHFEANFATAFHIVESQSAEKCLF
jgi:hypothetical protein